MSDWLLTIEELAALTKTTPEHIKAMALGDQGLRLSWVSARGYCVSRLELPIWRRAVAAARTETKT